jgi:cysteine desulfurase
MKNDTEIYLDYNATTPVDHRVFEGMLPWLQGVHGNASSNHAYGRRAAAKVQQSREIIASALGLPANGLVFTSGATESDNLALRGANGRVIVAATEHKAVLDTARKLEHVIVPVDRDGKIDEDYLEDRIGGAALVSVMLANNETGVVQNLSTIVEMARSHEVLVHTDATQAFGKIPLQLDHLDVDMVSISSHKIYGPQGIGALWIKRGVNISPMITGGGHEGGIRSGTLNIAGIVGFGIAAQTIALEEDSERSRRIVDLILTHLKGSGPFEVFSDHNAGLPNTLSIRFIGADAEAVIANAPEVAISTGSACTSMTPEPSHVLRAMGISTSAAYETLRISVGRGIDSDNAKRAAEVISRAVIRVRELEHEFREGEVFER